MRSINTLKLSLIISCLFLIGCDPVDRMKIINESSEAIYYFYSCDNSLRDLYIYRDSLYIDQRDGKFLRSHQYIVKDTFKYIGIRGFHGEWERYIDECKGNKIHFFIFSDSTVKKYSNQEIRYRKLYSKHYTFTKEELEHNNWTITILP